MLSIVETSPRASFQILSINPYVLPTHLEVILSLPKNLGTQPRYPFQYSNAALTTTKHNTTRHHTLCHPRGVSQRIQLGYLFLVQSIPQCSLPQWDEPTLLKTALRAVLVGEKSKRLCPAFAVPEAAVVLAAVETGGGFVT
jgi:hypothetical protein